jgi:hypothetical protein
MPIFDPNGNPLGAAPLVGAKKLTDYKPLTDEEMKVVVTQLEQAVSHGIPDEVPVTMATGIIIRLVRRAMVATEKVEEAAPALPDMPWITPMPEGRQVTLPPEFFKNETDTDTEAG